MLVLSHSIFSMHVFFFFFFTSALKFLAKCDLVCIKLNMMNKLVPNVLLSHYFPFTAFTCQIGYKNIAEVEDLHFSRGFTALTTDFRTKKKKSKSSTSVFCTHGCKSDLKIMLKVVNLHLHSFFCMTQNEEKPAKDKPKKLALTYHT